jgi:hypothetical protein
MVRVSVNALTGTVSPVRQGHAWTGCLMSAITTSKRSSTGVPAEPTWAAAVRRRSFAFASLSRSACSVSQNVAVPTISGGTDGPWTKEVVPR